VALALDRLVARSQTGDSPIKVLLKGPPGTGKSTLARYLLSKLDCWTTPWGRHEFSGTDVRLEVIQELSNKLAYGSMAGGWTCIWIEEADSMPMQAQTRFLKFMDDLPKLTAVIATSNACDAKFEERFQSRFSHTFDVDGPTASELSEFLVRFSDNRQIIDGVVSCACGGRINRNSRANVRQGLGDLDNALLCAA